MKKPHYLQARMSGQPDNRGQVTACLLLLLLLAAAVEFTRANEITSESDKSAPSYTVPNPFGLHQPSKTSPVEQKGEFYYLRSRQLSQRAHEPPHELLVEESFSLTAGLTYSLHRPLDKKGALVKDDTQAWALIGDSARSRFYLVRNALAPLNSPADFECELDHAHTHRHVFPWQFVYDFSSLEGGSQEAQKSEKKGKEKEGTKKKKKKKHRHAFVYGVGAIWLNAIDQEVRSVQVDERSTYELDNRWTLEGKNGLRVELMFKKLAANESQTADYQRALDSGALHKLRIERSELAETPALDEQLVHAAEHSSELIEVEEFRAGISRSKPGDPLVKRLLVQLAMCRDHTRGQRLFPSLLRAISTAPQRLYKIDYLERRLPLYNKWLAAQKLQPFEGKYDTHRHRYTFEREFVTEVFSLALEAQATIYSPVFLTSSSPGEGRTDVFISRFTERCNELRSSRHATAFYHIIEMDELSDDDNQICKSDEREPLPPVKPLVRPLRFRRGPHEYSSHLTGLGALLMNMADAHYKSFSLVTRTINVPENEADFSELRLVHVDHWKLVDEKLGWSFHFYVEQRDRNREPLSLDLTERARGDLSRLVRVDIRDDRTVDVSQDAVDQSGENESDDFNLLVQYSILQFSFESIEDDVEFLLTPPANCDEPHGLDDMDYYDSEESDVDSHFDDPRYKNDDLYYECFSDDSLDDSDFDDPKALEDKQREDQKHGEQFEFEPGEMEEELPLPDFFDYLDSRGVYEATSKLELTLQDSNGRTGGKKHIWLREQVDLSHETATLHVYNSDDEYDQHQAEESYHIFYDSELVFRVASGRCKHSDQVTPNNWLRLFSAPFTYYTVPNYRGKKHQVEVIKNEALVESSSISLYGVGALWRRASESDFSQFLGKRHGVFELNGSRYRRLVWAYEEHSMRLLFTFLQNLTMIEDDLRTHARRPKREYLSLHSIEFKNYFQDYDQPTELQSFGSIKAQLISFGGSNGAEVKPLEVPDLCRDQFIEALRLREQFETQIRPPGPFDLLTSGSRSYQLRYVVSHRIGADPKDPQYKSTSVFVSESFDLDKNRGKLTVNSGNLDLQVFIDGAARHIYAYSARNDKCNYISSLKSILSQTLSLDLDDAELISDFNLDKLYGLAGLWLKLSQMEAKMRVHFQWDRYGRKNEMRSYSIELRAADGHEQLVELNFNVRRTKLNIDSANSEQLINGLKARAKEQLQLESVNVMPIERKASKDAQANVARKHRSRVYNSRLYVDEMRPFVKLDWQLPKACAALTGTETADQPDSEKERMNPEKANETNKQPQVNAVFPKLTDLVPRENHFHMRAEVRIKGDLDKVYLLDEWVHNRHLRMRTRGLGLAARKNFDFLLYASSGEQFDLSRAFECRANHWPENALEVELGPELSSGTLGDLWTDDENILSHLSKSHYSPLTLWHQAEKAGVRVRLANTLDIAPIPVDTSRGAYVKQIEQELMRETWEVSAPENQTPGWSYKLMFIRNSRVLESGQVFEWRVLDGIQLIDQEPELKRADSIDQKPEFFDEELYTGNQTREFHIHVDVVNYNYHPEANDLLELFRLPEGWGCKRDEDFIKKLDRSDEFELDPAASWLLFYEASFELINPGPKSASQGIGIDDEDLGGQKDEDSLELGALIERRLEREMLPTVSGVFFRSGSKLLAGDNNGAKSPPQMDVFVHHNTIRFANGSASARKIVLDRAKSVEYEIDKHSGFCTVALVKADSGWRLEFPSKTSASSYSVNLISIPQLGHSYLAPFLPTGGNSSSNTYYKPLNVFMGEENVYHSTYELDFAWLKLSDQLQGPARAVRKFTHLQHQVPKTRTYERDGRRHVVTLHDTMSVRVFLFSVITKKSEELRAILDITIQRGKEPSLSSLLATANIRQCFNDGDSSHWDRQVQSFTLEYPAESGLMLEAATFFASKMRDHFYAMLLRASGLPPLQLDGQAQVELAAHENLLRIHFNVLETPTSYVYFREQVGASMADELATCSESRLLPTLLHCSRWCDQIQCVAMSYCADRLCRLVTGRALFGFAVRPAELSNIAGQPLIQNFTDEQLVKLAQSKPEEGCSYYHLNRPVGRITVAKFADRMARMVNEERSERQLEALALTFGPFKEMAPTRFYSTQTANFRWQHEDSDDSYELAGEEQLLPDEWHKRDFTYGLLRRHQELDATAVQALASSHSSDEKEAQFITISPVATSLAECFKACQNYDCLVHSYCKKGSICLLVRSHDDGQTDIDALKATFVDTDHLSDCSIYMRDFLSIFSRFEGTSAPREYQRRLEYHSALECAALCQADQERCLSFDLCTYTSSSSSSSSNSGAQNSLAFKQTERDESDTVCLLQKSHVSLDTFNRATMLPKWDSADGSQNRISGREVVCDHYSKRLLADFKRLPNKKLTSKLDTALRGVGEERCAAFCLQEDERCHAFEFCRNDQNHPAQACYLIRAPDLLEAVDEALESADDKGVNTNAGDGNGGSQVAVRSSHEQLTSLLASSKVCSIYVARRSARDERLNHTLQSLLPNLGLEQTSTPTSSYNLLAYIVYFLAAISAGALIQFIYIKTTNRALIFD